MPNGGVYSRGAAANELDKAIDAIYTDAGLGPMNQWEEVFKEEPALPGSSIQTSEISGLGTLSVVAEGGIAGMSTPTEGNKVTRYYTKAGLGFQVTEEMMQDELHERAKDMAKSLGTQTHQYINTSAFDLLNSGFATHETSDGLNLFSASHTLLANGGTLHSNLGAVDLSETGIQAAYEAMDNITTHNGNPDPRQLKRLVVSTSDQFKAALLTRNEFKLGSADRDKLTTNPSFGAMPGLNYMVCYYLTDSDSWFALADDHDLQIRFKMAPDLRKVDDVASGGRIYYSYVRFATFANKWQGIYGSAGAA